MAQLIPYHMTETHSIDEVTQIDRTGILFADGQTILFEECARNFRRAYPESGSSCVAERDISAEPPTFEFFAYGKSVVIRFDRGGSFSDSRNRKAFRELQERIEKFGYTTYDLS